MIHVQSDKLLDRGLLELGRSLAEMVTRVGVFKPRNNFAITTTFCFRLTSCLFGA
jgi:hypothetical protein